MDNMLLPNELFVTEHGALIRTRCPKDKITDAMLHLRVVNANLAAGDILKVQCMNHTRDTVLHFCEYMVYNRNAEFKRVDVNDLVNKQGEHVSFSVMPITDWKATPAGVIVESAAAAVVAAAALAAAEAAAEAAAAEKNQKKLKTATA